MAFYIKTFFSEFVLLNLLSESFGSPGCFSISACDEFSSTSGDTYFFVDGIVYGDFWPEENGEHCGARKMDFGYGFASSFLISIIAGEILTGSKGELLGPKIGRLLALT